VGSSPTALTWFKAIHQINLTFHRLKALL
jgi:hypothetical protein